MNFELSAPQLSELEQMVTNLFTNQKCNCHFINPSKTRILLWKETKKDGTVVYHLRIGIQKFISQACLDRNGETYWKFDFREKEELIEVNQEQAVPTPELDPITKFNQRQEQAKNGKANHTEQSVNHSQSS